jgi:hypothetical protein
MGLGEIAAKMIRVEFRRRRVCGAGKHDNHGECQNTSHVSPHFTAQAFSFFSPADKKLR